MSFDSAEFAWNSVDVRGDDGLLHNGQVIDAMVGGLVVDFGGTGQSGSRLIPSGQVYHRQYSDYLQRERMDEGLATLEEERTVEVLLRLQPEDPWKWYPGILLDAFGLVSVTLPDRQLKGFVVEQRIRERSSQEDLDDLVVGEDRFSRQLIVVQNAPGVLFPPDDQLMEIFNGHCRQRHYWMMATHVLNNPRHGLFKELAVLGIFDDQDDEFEVDGLGWPQHHGIRNECYHPLDELLLSLLNNGDPQISVCLLPPSTPSSDGDIQSLYRDPSIFPQIFECFTTLQQTKSRGVCKIWDGILTSGRICRVLTVSQPRYGRNYTRTVYRFASCLYHCWTKHTRVLVFYGGKIPDACDGVRLAETARLLQHIRTEKGLPDVEVLLLTREWHFRINAANWISALWEIFVSLAGVCRQVVLKNVGVNVVSDRVDRDFVVIRFSSHQMTHQLTIRDFWAMLNNLCDLDGEDMESLADWISRRSPQMTLPWNTSVAQILNITQALDARDGVHYRGISFNGEAAIERRCSTPDKAHSACAVSAFQ